MERIANRPILCHALERMGLAGIDSLAVVAPATLLASVQDAIARELPAGSAVTVLAAPEELGQLGTLSAAVSFVGDDPSVVHVADGLLGQPIDQVIDLDLAGLPDLLLLLHRSEESREGLGRGMETLLGVTELGGSRRRLTLAGVSVFGPGTLRLAARVASRLTPGAEFTEVVEQLSADGCTLDAGIVHDWRRYRGNPVDLLELNRIVLDQQASSSDGADRGDNTIEGRAIIDPSAQVTSSVILGPCIIGPHARVTSSYIGPYTSIGARADIEGAEIVRSIVSEGVSIKHVSERIEGSTIGKRASIFRDFGLPRAMRLHVGADVELALN